MIVGVDTNIPELKHLLTDMGLRGDTEKKHQHRKKKQKEKRKHKNAK